MDKHVKVAVVVVNYGTAECAISAVASVLRYGLQQGDLHVYLVDNASPGDDASVLERACAAHDWSGRVTLLRAASNLGFGAGNNLALEAMASDPPDFVFLLNPDARLKNNAVDHLTTALINQPDVAVVGAGISRPDIGPVTAAFRFPTIYREFVGALSFGPVSRLFPSGIVPLPADHPSGPVDWVAGAAAMFRYEVLTEIGGFDPEFFLYFEEVDLMRAISRRGWQVWYLPDAQVWHDEGRSTGVRSAEPQRRRKPSYWYASWRYYFAKNHGRLHALLAASAWLLGSLLNHGISALRGRQPAAPLRYGADFVRAGVLPLLAGGPVSCSRGRR